MRQRAQRSVVRGVYTIISFLDLVEAAAKITAGLMRLQYAEILYGESMNADTEAVDKGIESEIQEELEGMKNPEKAPLFVSIMLDVQCGQY